MRPLPSLLQGYLSVKGVYLRKELYAATATIMNWRADYAPQPDAKLYDNLREIRRLLHRDGNKIAEGHFFAIAAEIRSGELSPDALSVTTTRVAPFTSRISLASDARHSTTRSGVL